MGWPTHRVHNFIGVHEMTGLMCLQEYPPVKQLQVHLENEQRITFQPDGQHALTNMVNDTQLTGFFKANQKYPAAQELYYVEFPTKFVWNTETFKWVPCKKRTVFGRLVYIPPNAGEKFYTRLILSVVKNLQSFEDLRRFNGVLYGTIREACLAHGLLEDDGKWRRTLDEAKNIQTGFILHGLFVVVLRDCIPSDPLALWHKYKSFLCDDLGRLLPHLGFCNTSQEMVEDYGLYLIERTLIWGSNKSMRDVGMIAPSHDWDSLLSNPLLQDHLQFDAAEEERQLLETLPLLNEEQHLAFDCVMHSILSNEKRTFFVVSAARAGKTFLYNTLCNAICSRTLVVLCVAYSGIAAQLLPGGRTAHSMFKIPFEIMEDSVCAIPKNSSLADVLKMAALIIWDECSAQHRFAFEAVDRTLRDLRDSNDLFGGIPTVLGGDFLQTLPVVKTNLRSPIVHACLLSSPLWVAIKHNVLKLERNMHIGSSVDDQFFAAWQRELAAGTLNMEDQTVNLPKSMLCPSDTIADLIAHVYPNIADQHPDSYYREHCILAPQNTEMNEINADVLHLFPGVEEELWAVDHALD
jgi:hypothetical protein